MPSAKQEAAVARIETGETVHEPIIEYADRADVPRLIAERAAAGRVAPGAGLLVIPETAPSIEEWERRVREGQYHSEPRAGRTHNGIGTR